MNSCSSEPLRLGKLRGKCNGTEELVSTEYAKPGGQGWEMKEEDRQHGVSEMSSQLSELLKIERFKSELAWIPFY